jgi:hypothetical protein
MHCALALFNYASLNSVRNYRMIETDELVRMLKKAIFA